MTVETAAAILGLTGSSILKYISSGKLKAAKYGKQYDIEPEALIDFFRQTWAVNTDLEKFLNKRADLVDGPAKAKVYDLLSMA